MQQLNFNGAVQDPAVFASNTVSMTAGVLFMFKIKVYGTTFSNVLIHSAVALVGGTHCYVGVYKSDGTQSAAMATATVDALTACQATAGIKTIALTNSVTVSDGDDVYVTVLVTGTPTTAMTLRSYPGLSNGDLTSSQGYRSATFSTGLSALPGSVTLTSMASQGNPIWAAVR
jgi:hypothetical protein